MIKWCVRFVLRRIEVPSGVERIVEVKLSFGKRRQRPGGRRTRARREAGGRHCEEWD